MNDLVEITVRFQRDQDYRLVLVHMRVPKADISNEKLYQITLATWGGLDNYDSFVNVDVQIGRPTIVMTGEMVRNFITRVRHKELQAAAG